MKYVFILVSPPHILTSFHYYVIMLYDNNIIIINNNNIIMLFWKLLVNNDIQGPFFLQLLFYIFVLLSKTSVTPLATRWRSHFIARNIAQFSP